jgi:MFS family permease
MVFLPGMAVAGLGVAPPTASLMLLPLVAMLVIGAPTAGYLLDKVGAKPVIQIGLGCTILGLIGFGTLPQSTLSFYATGSLIGLGLSSLLGAPLRYVAMQEAGASQRGVSQGLLTLFLSIGQLLGAAIVGGLVASASGTVQGFQHAMLVLASGCAIAFLLSRALNSGSSETRRA